MTHDSLDLDRYFPFFLGTIANRWTATSSRTYLERFGIGIGEWRVLASICALGRASSQEVVNLIAMDAGAVSRSMARLRKDGLVKAVAGKFAGRTKPFELSGKGKELYATIRDVATEREDRLLADLTPDEREELLRLMRKIMPRLDQL